MRLNFSTLPAIVIGALAMTILLYYYYLEKDFRQNYKEVTASFSILQQDQERITYGILQSALFAYYNQDALAADRQNIYNHIRHLRQSKMLQEELYASLELDLSRLQQEIDEYIELIENYLIINTGIKNSYVFLSTHESKAHNFFPIDSKEALTIHTMVSEVIQARRMLDSSFMQNFSKHLESLQNGNYNKEQKKFIDTILLHGNFIDANYKSYIDTFSAIINTPLRTHMESVKLDFVELSKQDLIFLNRLALTLFILIFVALIVIIALLMLVQKDNIKLLEAGEQLRYSLRHDALTSLYNRHCYEEDLATLAQPVILLLNISGFKLINDFYGTEEGDAILKKTALLIQEYAEGQAIKCYRIGGDEFALLFDNTAAASIEEIAHTLNDLITSRSYSVADFELTLRLNMAISTHLPLLETADMALKHLKAQPSSHLIHYTPSLNVKKQIQENIEITQTIRDALKDDRIYPFYQPIIDLETREIVKYEALVRLELPNGDILTPYHFLSIAQHTPLYREISRTVINKSIHYFSDKPYRFSINLSMQDLLDDDIVNTLLGQLATNPDAASHLDIELLESDHLFDMSKVKAFIGKIRNFGCRISIDDFGSGYANFSYLAELDVDTVKIDGSLIKEIMDNPQHLETVKAIMGLANSLKIESVAEFVQDEKSAQLLHGLGVTYAQGFYFGKPDREIVAL
ncbi:MAG: EAL domain-containing protein [Campylobacterota bacterium]|nr:EAL domain-containing protein [Campylobacterota bacterium]